MFKNYIKIAARGLVKKKIFSFINIFGLDIAIAFCVLIFLFVRDEMTHDNFHHNADRLYRVNVVSKDRDGSTKTHAMTPLPLGPAFKQDFPEIVHAARFLKRGDVVVHQGQSSRESIALADPDFFKMFSFPLLKGNPETVLANRDAVVLREETAERYFGREDPIGKFLSIQFGSRFYDFEVAGVAANLPSNSSITFDLLVSFDRVRDYTSENNLNNWLALTTLTFIELQEDARETDLASKFPVFIQKHLDAYVKKYRGGDSGDFRFELQLLEDVYLNTQLRSAYVAGSNPVYSYILSGIALLILIIAAINYMNLAIARSATRLREIGVRKVLGADRKKLMNQFFGESLFFSFISLCMGIAVAELFLPGFNSFTNKNLAIGYFSDWTTPVSIVGLMIIVGLLSGSYPALFLSGFRPADVLRSHLGLRGKSKFSQWLVVVQFTMSIFLIISTLIMTQQLNYLRNRDLGIQGEQVVVIPTQGNPQGTQLVDRFRNELSTARKISQKNVCRMYDLHTEKGRYFITMEYVSGGDLKRFIRRSKQLTEGTAISIAKQIYLA